MTTIKLENQLIAANALIFIGSVALSYQIKAQIIDRLARSSIKIPTIKNYVSILGFCLITQLFVLTPHLTFLSLCVASVALTVAATRQSSSEKVALPSFMRDLVEEAKLIKDCYTIGHEKYITQLETILWQQEKNNGILVGPAGVGKSAIFETIAWKIAHNQFPPNSRFTNRRLIGITAATLIAGTSLRGDLEFKVQQMINLAQQDPTIIFVIDEIHKIVGGGVSSDKNGDIANQLKPALARPGLTVLGATTSGEFSLFFEKDPTLMRRFKTVTVEEPTSQECLEMLQQRQNQGYFNHNEQKVTFSIEALQAAIFFSKQDSNKHLPAAANDLLDSVRANALMNCTDTQELNITPEMIAQSYASDHHIKDLNPLMLAFNIKKRDWFSGEGSLSI